MLEGAGEASDDYEQHKNGERAAAVGCGAAVGSLAGGIVVGGLAASGCGATVVLAGAAPVCAFVGASLGSYLGGKAGAYLGGTVYEHRDQVGGFFRSVGGCFQNPTGGYG